jgi:subtilase family serine protease
MLEVTVKVCNQGTQGGSAPLDIYFSTDASISMNDLYSTSLPMPWLDAGACATVIGNAWAPNNSGTYYVGAIIDGPGFMPELFKDNDIGVGNRVGVGSAPDFYLKSVSTAPSATPYSPVTVSAMVCNQGTTPGSAPVFVFFSTDTTIDGMDYFGGILPPIPFLPPGGCDVATGTFPAPPQGTYWVGAVVDFPNFTPELFEDNNTLVGNRIGVGYAPDFIVSSVTTAPSALPGSQLTVTATVCNQGTQAGSTPLDLYFSTDATITTSDVIVSGFPPSTVLDPGACVTQSATVYAPPQGTYYVGAIADSFNWTTELLEDNNARASAPLSVGYGPDYVVTSVTAAPTATPGGNVSVTAVVCNQGTQGASPPGLDLFFSRDATITGEDVYAGPMFPPPPWLDPGACATLTTNAPAPQQPGTYYVGVIADRFGFTPELREDNNATAGNRVGVGFAPDFYVSSVSTAETALPGSMVPVTAVVCNQGTQGGSALLDVYFSTDDYLSMSDTYSTSLPMPWLDPGACATVTGNAWTPGPSGTYFVGTIIDGPGFMPELFKDNNTRAGNRVGVGSAPDFAVSSVSSAPSAQPGSQVTVTARVCNLGTTPGSAPVGIFFSTDATITNTDYLGGFFPPNPFLQPGGCDMETMAVPAPPQGTYFVGAIADPFNDTTELFEDNNAMAGNRLAVGNGADFVISSVSTAHSALPGAQLTITATLCNQGTSPGGAPVDLFFSTDATITTSDLIVWGFPYSNTLQPGDCITQSANVGAPPQGTYWVGAIADSFNSVTELLDDNNATAGNEVVIGNGPDFTVTAITTAASATPGGSDAVTATLCNQGTQGAGAPMVEIYFSTDTTITAGDFRGGPLAPGPWLDPGACTTLSGNFPAPPNAGTYFVGAITDGTQTVTELREDNNATAGGRIGVGFAPDFIVTAVSTTTPSVFPNGQLQVSATVCNQGTQGGGAPVDIYFSTDSSVTVADLYGSPLQSPYLQPGECSTATGSVWAPWSPGTYFVGAIVDGFGNGPELFRDNNAGVGNQVAVGYGPDLVVTSISGPATAQPWTQITVTATVCNQGTNPGDSGYLEVHLSTDPTITQQDFFAGSLPSAGMLSPGACANVTGTVIAAGAGTYTLGGIADGSNFIQELREDNNARASATALVIGP